MAIEEKKCANLQLKIEWRHLKVKGSSKWVPLTLNGLLLPACTTCHVVFFSVCTKTGSLCSQLGLSLTQK